MSTISDVYFHTNEDDLRRAPFEAGSSSDAIKLAPEAFTDDHDRAARSEREAAFSHH